jgi:Na+-transporting methylmalonyl-CoA/oxaloacetate decarboxylase gamma subunit
MTADISTSIRASRFRVPRTRGATSGALLLVLGAWAALVPLIGPYFDLAYTPAPNDAWHWTAARGWLEVLPGCVAFLGGLLLLVSASRVVTSFGGWLAAAGGSWLIVGPPLADAMDINLGSPDPTSSTSVQALQSLLLFYGVGAVILFLASLALGRLSVHSVRDVRAAERRVAEEQAAEAAAMAQAREQVAAEIGRHGRRDDDNVVASQSTADKPREPEAPTYATPPSQPTYPPPSYQQPGYGTPRDESTSTSTYARTAPPPPPEDR